MITLSMQKQNGEFVYTDESLNVTGFYEATQDGTLVRITADYNSNGNASVFRNLNEDGVPQYGIVSKNPQGLVVISDSIETIWNEVSESIKDSEEQEEEQTEQVQGKKK